MSGVLPVAGQARKLALVKLLHTMVWAFFVSCIVGIPIACIGRQFRWADVLAGIVLLECSVLAVNKGRCPLTDVARRYSDDCRANFDIYLPEWLARHNKLLFGSLFVADLVFLARQFI